MAESRQDSWWQQALAVKPAIDSVNVDGSRIEYQHWGDRTKPALIFYPRGRRPRQLVGLHCAIFLPIITSLSLPT